MILTHVVARVGAVAALAVLAACGTVPPVAAPEPSVAPAPVVQAPEPPASAPTAQPATEVAPPRPVSTAEAWRNRERQLLPGDPTRTDLWARVRQGFAMNDLDDGVVRKWEAYYADKPDYVARMMDRGSRYLFHIVEEVDNRGMPLELALLPFIESAFNPQAESSARAAGMWQFMAATGRDFDLRQNVFRDDRRDILASTRAALDYLQQLHGQFGDWHLALAAYNWGPGSVQRAQRRNAVRGRPTDYLSLDMPAETRNYVPKLQAVKNIVLRPDGFGLALPTLENHPFFLGVGIERDIDVALAARLAGLSVAEFQQYNPQMNKPVILAAGTPQLLLPYDNANLFLHNLAAHRGPLASWTAWVAPRTLSPAEAARQVGMTEQQLREVNRIPPRMRVKAGSTLLVPRPAHATEDVGEHLAEHAAILLAPDAPTVKRVVFKARKGDSVSSVARRYGVRESDVARWNRTSVGARFAAGSRVVVMVPQKTRVAAGSSKRRPTPARAAKTLPSKTRVTAP